MERTVVRSFTTKFNMKRLFLRGLALSPHGRYLAFAADDQENWDLVIDGPAITRIHFHQLGDWTRDDAMRALAAILAGECGGDLRYALWDIVSGESPAAVGDIVDQLQGMDLPADSCQHRQRLLVLNGLSCALEVCPALLAWECGWIGCGGVARLPTC
ncbi:hypothetical protein H4R21_001901 [Coemansia helicoidea]|uniref:Uncharacterized protein n=1 Tax=Coemansia helicoidea TaxID=1286919 RepID=A0ACC1LA43_9FUNG|nr:hypothetical protein H4R21_001901 [Coemansia helicoidea]